METTGILWRGGENGREVLKAHDLPCLKSLWEHGLSFRLIAPVNVFKV